MEKTCCKCKLLKPLDDFYQHQRICKVCRKAVDKEWYWRNPKKKERNKLYRRKKVEEIRQIFAEAKACGCKYCSEKCLVCLEFHHLEPSQKDFDLSSAVKMGYNIEKIINEIRKCIVVCSNCHKKIHAGIN